MKISYSKLNFSHPDVVEISQINYKYLGSINFSGSFSFDKLYAGEVVARWHRKEDREKRLGRD